MMTFDTFFEQVVSHAELIASGDQLRRKWVDKADGITSAYDFEELDEQLLGDLKVHDEIRRFSRELAAAGALDAAISFSEAFLAVERALASDRRLSNPATLLASPEWRALQDAASVLIDLPSASHYRGA